VHNLYHSHLTATARLMNLFSLAIFALVNLFCGCWLHSYAKLFCSPKPEPGK